MSLSNCQRKLARQLMQSQFFRKAVGTNTARLLPSITQQRSFLTDAYSSSSRSTAAAPASTTTSATISTDSAPYKSELQDLFDIMEQNGPTTLLGTTLEQALMAQQQPTKCLRCGVPEHALRFTTTCYGRTQNAPHVHPNEHRVILKVPVEDLQLTDLEYSILLEIVGRRRVEPRNELRLTSNQFGSRIENKRHLVSMLDRIVISCRRLAKELENEEEELHQETA